MNYDPLPAVKKDDTFVTMKLYKITQKLSLAFSLQRFYKSQHRYHIKGGKQKDEIDTQVILFCSSFHVCQMCCVTDKVSDVIIED